MLYLLDASTLITANNSYYPIDIVPEFWEWIEYQGSQGQVKIPVEMIDEIKAGNSADPLYQWIKNSNVLKALELAEEVDAKILQAVLDRGYGNHLTDVELQTIGNDPFLVAYAHGKSDRCVVTSEVSRPKSQRKNRKIPDVCTTLSIKCCNPFELNRKLGFRTAWKR